MPLVLPQQDIRSGGWHAPPGGPDARCLTRLPDELLALVLQFLDTRSRASAALVCKPLAALIMQPCSPVWGEVNLLEIQPQIEDWRDAEHYDVMLMSGGSAAALMRWWRRHGGPSAMSHCLRGSCSTRQCKLLANIRTYLVLTSSNSSSCPCFWACLPYNRVHSRASSLAAVIICARR